MAKGKAKEGPSYKVTGPRRALLQAQRNDSYMGYNRIPTGENWGGGDFRILGRGKKLLLKPTWTGENKRFWVCESMVRFGKRIRETGGKE